MTRELPATAGTDSGLTSPRSSGRARVRPIPTTITPSEAAALAFLADFLVGDTTWSLGEVQDMLALHVLNGLGHWHSQGLHDVEAATA
jgi:hypothetical protein